jgi:hypothetical protein
VEICHCSIFSAVLLQPSIEVGAVSPIPSHKPTLLTEFVVVYYWTWPHAFMSLTPWEDT